MTAKARGLGPAAPGELDLIATAKRRSDTAPQVNCLKRHMEAGGNGNARTQERATARREGSPPKSVSRSLSPFKSALCLNCSDARTNKYKN